MCLCYVRLLYSRYSFRWYCFSLGNTFCFIIKSKLVNCILLLFILYFRLLCKFILCSNRDCSIALLVRMSDNKSKNLCDRWHSLGEHSLCLVKLPTFGALTLYPNYIILWWTEGVNAKSVLLRHTQVSDPIVEGVGELCVVIWSPFYLPTWMC